MNNRQWALSVLGLPTNATDDEIRTAYRDLVSIWHPDHHQKNERIRRRAEEMLKKINAARDILNGGAGSADGWEAEPGDIPREDERQAPTEDEWTESTDYETDSNRTEAVQVKTRKSVVPLALFGVACGCLVIAAFTMPSNPLQFSAQESVAPASPIGTTYSTSVQQEPEPAASDLSTTQSVSAEPEGDTNSEDAPPSTPEELPYLTKLSLENDDLEYGVEGETTVRARVYSYGGEAEVLCRLESGTRVRVDKTSRADWLAIALPNRNRGLIRTKQVASTGVAKKMADSTYERDPVPKEDSQPDADKSSFTIGSTMEQVKAVQGTPSSVASYGWSYGYSSVSFGADGKVDGYSNLGKNLKVQMTPSKPNRTKTRFSVGSTKDDVLLIQGTPTGVASYGWSYGYSSVSFGADGKVDGYSNLGKNLKVE